MTETTEEFVHPFQHAGEICTSCQPFWHYQKLPGVALVSVPKRTLVRHIPIDICPYCDGETIRRLNGSQ